MVHAALDTAIFNQPAGAYSFSVEGFTNLGIGYNGSGTGNATLRLVNASDPGHRLRLLPEHRASPAATSSSAPPAATCRPATTTTYTIIHEIGHSLGLKHGHETQRLRRAARRTTDSIEFSVMTYKQLHRRPTPSSSTTRAWGYAADLHDATTSPRSSTCTAPTSTSTRGNTIYTWNPTSGESYVNGTLAIDPGGNRIFQTIWDGNGTDTYDLSNYSTNLSHRPRARRALDLLERAARLPRRRPERRLRPRQRLQRAAVSAATRAR